MKLQTTNELKSSKNCSKEFDMHLKHSVIEKDTAAWDYFFQIIIKIEVN